jgi:hypothetical protein
MLERWRKPRVDFVQRKNGEILTTNLVLICENVPEQR